MQRHPVGVLACVILVTLGTLDGPAQGQGLPALKGEGKPGADAGAGLKCRSAAVGNVKAEWCAPEVWTGRSSSEHLLIARMGNVLVDGPGVTCEANNVCSSHSLDARDLDGDGEPEVLVGYGNPSARGNPVLKIFRFLSQTGKYAASSHPFGDVINWGEEGELDAITDLDGDGRPEFLIPDTNFECGFGDCCATSVEPLHIWHFEHGRMLDVTSRFSKVIQGWADDLRRQFPKTGDGNPGRGTMAAWMAYKALLGQEDEGWRTLCGYAFEKDRLFASDDKGPFVKVLRKFLADRGYSKAMGSSASCQKYKDCLEDGACSYVDGCCRLTSTADCSRTRSCREDGRCVFYEGRCLSLTEAQKAARDGRREKAYGTILCGGSEECDAGVRMLLRVLFAYGQAFDSDHPPVRWKWAGAQGFCRWRARLSAKHGSQTFTDAIEGYCNSADTVEAIMDTRNLRNFSVDVLEYRFFALECVRVFSTLKCQ